jgi:hypothetical protein
MLCSASVGTLLFLEQDIKSTHFTAPFVLKNSEFLISRKNNSRFNAPKSAPSCTPRSPAGDLARVYGYYAYLSNGIRSSETKNQLSYLTPETPASLYPYYSKTGKDPMECLYDQ